MGDVRESVVHDARPPFGEHWSVVSLVWAALTAAVGLAAIPLLWYLQFSQDDRVFHPGFVAGTVVAGLLAGVAFAYSRPSRFFGFGLIITSVWCGTAWLLAMMVLEAAFDSAD